MTLAEGDIKVIREGETHLIAVCISGFVTSVVCFCALYTANKYRLYKGPHWLKLKTRPITSQNFVEFLQFSSVCRSPTVKLCCFMQHILEETETYVYTWVYPSSCHVWSLAVEGGGVISHPQPRVSPTHRSQERILLLHLIVIQSRPAVTHMAKPQWVPLKQHLIQQQGRGPLPPTTSRRSAPCIET